MWETISGTLLKSFYTFLFLALLPISGTMIFKPRIWQGFYANLYLSQTSLEEDSVWKVLLRSFLAMISTDVGSLIHRVLGGLLLLVDIYIFWYKLGGEGFFSF